MNYRDFVAVIETSPKNNDFDVATTAQVKLTFNTDIDVNLIKENVHIHDSLGNRVEFNYTYDTRMLTLKPVKGFIPNSNFVVTVVGDNKLDPVNSTGIKSILGIPMAGNFSFTFTTVSITTRPAPKLIYPTNQTIIKDKSPLLKWEPIPDITRYEVELSRFSNMRPLSWFGEVKSTEVDVVPYADLIEGDYYWRVRAVNEDDYPGDWSSIFLFRLDLTDYNPITKEDISPIDYIPGELLDDIYIDESDLILWPEDDFSNVATNLKSIYVTFPKGLIPDNITVVQVFVNDEPKYLNYDYSLNKDWLVFNYELPADANIILNALITTQKDKQIIVYDSSIPFPIFEVQLEKDLTSAELLIDGNEDIFTVVGENAVGDSDYHGQVTGKIFIEHLRDGSIVIGYELDPLEEG